MLWVALEPQLTLPDRPLHVPHDLPVLVITQELHPDLCDLTTRSRAPNNLGNNCKLHWLILHKKHAYNLNLILKRAPTSG